MQPTVDRMLRYASLAVMLLVVLLLGFLLFGMPIDFLIACFHMYRVDSCTEGLITSVSVDDDVGAALTRVSYTYAVGGKSYASERMGTGLASGEVMEDGGDALADKYWVGSGATVYYDSRSPSFSLLEYGLPRFSTGFSLALCAIVAGVAAGRRKNWGLLEKPVFIAVLVTAVISGFVVGVAFPKYIWPRHLPHIIWAYMLLFVLVLIVGRFSGTAAREQQ